MDTIPETSSLITAPASEPLSVEEAKLHLRVEAGMIDDDDLINGCIETARMEVEGGTGRALITQTWELWRPWFHQTVIELPKAPCTEVQSVKYIDTAGVEQTLATTVYETSLPAGPRAAPGCIALKDAQAWPSTAPVIHAVKIRYSAGYGPGGGDVPFSLLAAMLLLIGHLYENRGVMGQIPETVENLLASYSITRF